MRNLAFKLLVLATLVCTACYTQAGAVSPPTPVALQPALLVSSTEERMDAAPHVLLRHSIWHQRYAVGGRSVRELRSGLDRGGPFNPQAGRRYDAETQWALRWTMRYDRDSEAACRLENATIQLEDVMLLPDMAAQADASPQLQEQWRVYVAALVGHEEGHVQRHIEIARALRDEFVAQAPEATCRDLGLKLNALGEQAIAAIRASDLDYDVDTDHGASQGAVFP